jgi:hypothetical protein
MNFLPTVQKPLNDQNILSDDETEFSEEFMPEPVMKPKPVPEDIFETTQKQNIDCENVEQSEEEYEQEPPIPHVKIVKETEPESEPESQPQQVIKKPRVKAEVHEEGYKETGYIVIMCKNGKKRWMRENYKEVQGARMKQNILLHKPKRGKNKPNPIVQQTTEMTKELHEEQLRKIQEENRLNQEKMLQFIQISNINAINEYEKIRKSRKAEKKNKQAEEKKVLEEKDRLDAERINKHLSMLNLHGGKNLGLAGRNRHNNFW